MTTRLAGIARARRWSHEPWLDDAEVLREPAVRSALTAEARRRLRWYYPDQEQSDAAVAA